MNHLLQTLGFRSWWNATGKRTMRTFLLGVLSVPASWVLFVSLEKLPWLLSRLSIAWVSGIGLAVLTVFVAITILQAKRNER